MIDAQTLLDYLGDLDNESDEEIIQRFEQAKADCAGSWILDGDAWATNYYSLWEVWIALGIALAILAGALTVKACVNDHYKDANTKVWMVKHDVLQEQLNKDYYNKITYDGRQQLMCDIASYNSTVLMGRAKKHSKWIGVFYSEDWDSIPLIELNEEG